MRTSSCAALALLALSALAGVGAQNGCGFA